MPLVSRILPSDICKIHKCGSSIRLDTTLVDFSDMRWERGDISFIFRGDSATRESLTVLDNEFQCYQRVRYEETDAEIEDEVDILMSTDILAAQMSTKNINFVRAQSGWIFREDRKELVAGQYDCDLYTLNGLVLESRKRREHLSGADLQRNKALMESLKNAGPNAQSIDQNGEVIVSGRHFCGAFKVPVLLTFHAFLLVDCSTRVVDPARRTDHPMEGLYQR